jgi:ribonucleoside-diphosphate reductase alpha chain
MCSACYVNSVEDSMTSILELAATEARIFKKGGGSGVNFSNLRGSNERLSRGGVASGPVSFMKGFDAFAGVIKSGGRCLSPNQRVYTVERGPVRVSDLADLSFHVLSFDPPSGRFKVKRATAWKERDRKRIVRIVTDKGEFRLSEDHPVKLATGAFVPACELRQGTPLFATTLDEHDGYVRVGLRDNKKGRDLLHRLAVKDVLGEDLTGKIVHHRDNNPLNNEIANLEVMTQSEHVALHDREAVTNGTHPFVVGTYPKKGSKNGMHASGEFWGDETRANAYREAKRLELVERGSARDMQNAAASSRMMNTAWKILEGGGSIETFDDYCRDRKRIVGSIGNSKHKLLQKIEARFGTYDAFRKAVAANNHRVVSVEFEGISEVYDVEVECSTYDDKSERSGHNFLIWSSDDRFGSGVVVSNTRRAAKIAVLDVDHPDVLEFARSKRREEAKARALVVAGYGTGIDGEAYGSVAFQNQNHSVRVTDAFMRAVEADGTWKTVERTTGEETEVPVRKIWREVVEAAHACGDPGLQFDDATNRWHTSPAAGRINAANPCGEFVFLDDSACNLASLNLRAFQRNDGGLDVDRFVAAVDVAITAQDAIVDRAAYPTERIGENARRYRPLGLGYANLGAFLMARGLAYDSPDGREVAAAVTALMTGRAYRRSAQIARTKGAFDGYSANRGAMISVIERHLDALDEHEGAAVDEFEAAHHAWEAAHQLGGEHGFRNAQVTLLAPTGTISFVMDCDTTGLEPDLALAKEKELVGGGTIRSMNGTVGVALRVLGYGDGADSGLLSYLQREGTFAGSHLKDEHLPVFDCALPDAAGRSIGVDGHLLMMAAVQPFLSGAISKTVNLPTVTTVEDVADAYLRAWKLGLKSITVYRDKSKEFQPLKATKSGDLVGNALVELVKISSTREKLPEEARTVRHHFDVGGVDGYFHVGLYDDGRVGEVFARVAKEGSTISGLLDAFATAVSIGLQYGVPFEVLVRKFSHWRFEPSGFSTDDRIGHADSIVDYLFRWLNLRFPGGRDPAVTAPQTPPKTAKERIETTGTPDASGPPCAVCGALTRPNGACFVCPRCATTTGCG